MTYIERKEEGREEKQRLVRMIGRVEMREARRHEERGRKEGERHR